MNNNIIYSKINVKLVNYSESKIGDCKDEIDNKQNKIIVKYINYPYYNFNNNYVG